MVALLTPHADGYLDNDTHYHGRRGGHPPVENLRFTSYIVQSLRLLKALYTLLPGRPGQLKALGSIKPCCNYSQRLFTLKLSPLSIQVFIQLGAMWSGQTFPQFRTPASRSDPGIS